MTEAQLELLRDKHVLWDRASREGAMDLRDYNRRAAEALKQLLAEHSEFSRVPVDVTTHHPACQTGYSRHCREPVHDVDGCNYCDLCGLWEGAR